MSKYSKPEELNIAKTVLSVVLPQIGKEVSSIKDLQNPKVIERIASAAVAAQKFADGLFPTVTLEQATAVAEEVCRQFVQRTIAIPTLTITPKQQVSFGFKPFELDVKSWNYQPLSKELMIQILRTEARSTISGEAGGERPERLEDYLVTKLIDFPEVDYEAHANILYGLAGQVVSHFRAKYRDEEQLRTVLQGHAKQMAEAIFVQMKQNMWREQSNYRVTVTAAFEHLKPQTFDGSSQDTVRDFRHPPERLQDIKRFIFGGFAKCCYQMAKFDSDTERKMAVILEQDATVQLWMKPGPNQFKIFDADGLPYQPDFVVETDTDKLIIETKRASEMEAATVRRKADAASLWAFIATEVHGKKIGDKPWSYLLVPENAVLGNATVKGLLSNCQRLADAALLANSRGEQWTYNGFSTVWHRFKTGLEAEGLIQPGLTLKGLRHTVATTLREAGLDERRIADLLGQKTLSMARHYSRSANLAAKNRETMATLETENARRARIVKPSAKSVKPEPKGKSE